MTVASILSTGVDNFFECSLAVRIAFLFIPIAIIFQVCGIGTESWSNTDDSNQGLWKYCYDSGDYSCCQSVADRTGDTPGWLTAAQVFQCIAAVMALVTMVAIILYSCVTKTLKSFKVNIFTIVCCFIAAFALMVSVSIYGDNYRKANWLQGHHLSGSFAVVLIAFFLYAVTAVILIVSECQNRQSRASVQPVIAPRTDTAQIPAQPRNQKGNTAPFHVQPTNLKTNVAQVPVQPSAPPMPVNNQPTPPSQNQTSNECILCMDRQREVIFLDCGHIACCENCANVVMNSDNKCPTCRQDIREKRRCFNA